MYKRKSGSRRGWTVYKDNNIISRGKTEFERVTTVQYNKRGGEREVKR